MSDQEEIIKIIETFFEIGKSKKLEILKDIDRPGDKIQFGDLTIRFLVDEDLSNFMEIQNWIRGLGFPEKLSQFSDLEKEAVMPSNFENRESDIFSDGTLLDSSNRWRD